MIKIFIFLYILDVDTVIIKDAYSPSVQSMLLTVRTLGSAFSVVIGNAACTRAPDSTAVTVTVGNPKAKM